GPRSRADRRHMSFRARAGRESAGLPWARRSCGAGARHESMSFARARCDRARAKIGDDVDRGANLLEAKPAAGQDFLIAADMQVGEPFREFQLFTVDRDRPVSRFAVAGGLRNVGSVNREKPAYFRPAAFEIAGGPL